MSTLLPGITIEHAWVEAKLWLKGSQRPNINIQAHLDAMAWKKMVLRNQDMDSFIQWLKEVESDF